MHKITLVSPFPLGRGQGDGGRKALIRLANPATKIAVPLSGRVRRHPIPASPGFSPPWVCLYGMICQCRKRFSAGVPGASAPGEIN